MANGSRELVRGHPPIQGGNYVGGPPTRTRDGLVALLLFALLAGAPTIAFAVLFSSIPFAAVFALPTAAYATWRLASRVDYGFYDTGPIHAAIVQSCVVWAGLAVSYPATLAFDIARTFVWQWIAGGFVAVLGPGVASHVAGVPRGIPVPIAQPMQEERDKQQRVVSGAQLTDFDEVFAEQADFMQQQEPAPPAGEDSHYRDPYFDEDEDD